MSCTARLNASLSSVLATEGAAQVGAGLHSLRAVDAMTEPRPCTAGRGVVHKIHPRRAATLFRRLGHSRPRRDAHLPWGMQKSFHEPRGPPLARQDGPRRTFMTLPACVLAEPNPKRKQRVARYGRTPVGRRASSSDEGTRAVRVNGSEDRGELKDGWLGCRPLRQSGSRRGK